MKKNITPGMGNVDEKKLDDFLKTEKKQKDKEEKLKNKEDKKKAKEQKLKAKEDKMKTKFKSQKEEVEIKKKKIQGEIKEQKDIYNKFNKFKGIGFKILGSFFIPIILMAIFGVVSYMKSSEAIVTSYVKSTTDTLNAVSDYLSLGLYSVEQKSVEFSFSENLTGYYDRSYAEDSIDDIIVYRALEKEAIVAAGTNSFISGIYTFGNVGSSTSTSGSLPKDMYTKYLETEDGKRISEDSKKAFWIGNHSVLDEASGITNEEYAISIIRKMTYKNGFIVMDISKAQVMKALTEIDCGKGSVLGFITSDGREILTNESESVFGELSYYQDSVASKEESGHSYHTYDNVEYLYLYSKIGETGAMVCALVPQSTIIGQANDIKILSVGFVVLASILAIIIGTLLATGISGAVSKLMKSITLASKGDLTVKFVTKRKDEFSVLSNSLTDMVGGMRKLIGEAADVGSKVNESAGTLSVTSESILGATKDISLTIDDIEKGVVQQASDTELCLGQMSNLSDKINQVYSSTYEIEQIANDTKSIIGEGIVIVDELNNKTKATTDITHVVIREIEDLEVHSHSIGNFVGIINEIASQTNLLSLNASIEAARAGDAGRGFAVVADEIRKLADQSVKAASEIQGIVTEIQSKTQGTVTAAKQAESIVGTQAEALNRTVSVFENINKHVGKLANNLDNISIGVKGIESAKEDTLDAIRNISAVSQETAAASEEVSATANNQILSVENLSQSALELSNDAKKLEEAIQLFKIN